LDLNKEEIQKEYAEHIAFEVTMDRLEELFRTRDQKEEEEKLGLHWAQFNREHLESLINIYIQDD